MNLALSDEQMLLREAARGALSRFKTLEAAREALDEATDGKKRQRPDPGSRTSGPSRARPAGPDCLIDEDQGGAGLDAFDAMLVLGECGRVLAGVPLLGHLPATAILDDSPNARGPAAELASGEQRAAYLPSRPPDDLDDAGARTRERHRAARAADARARPAADGRAPLSGTPLRSSPTRPARTCSSASRFRTATRGRRRRSRADARRASTVEPRDALRRDAAARPRRPPRRRRALVLDAPEDSLIARGISRRR